MSEPWRIIEGDSLAVLRTLPDGAFQTCVTSPPYFALRDYGTATWEGGDAACDHKQATGTTRGGPHSTLTSVGVRDGVNGNVLDTHSRQYRDLCGKCGARRVDLQLGLERVPDCFAWARGEPGACGGCYVCKMTRVFREVKRVLRADATLWVNISGGYASGSSGQTRDALPDRLGMPAGHGRDAVGMNVRREPTGNGWKAKDYVNVPALLAESLRADGWFFRAEVALTKVAPMPESCRDRPTRATEKLYLFAVSGRYFYDGEAERATALQPEGEPKFTGQHASLVVCNGPFGASTLGTNQGASSRNLWDWWDDSDDDLPPAVWPWRPEPQKKGSKHYATFPLWLPLRCVRLATSARGACPSCGAPWRRVVERKSGEKEAASRPRASSDVAHSPLSTLSLSGNGSKEWAERGSKTQTLGWQQGCKCPPHDPIPCAVLDPFAGTATTGVAARLLGRTFTGIELSAPYAAVARERLASACPLDDAAFARTQPPPAAPGLFDEEQP